jgi:hypothetical protein
MRIVFWIWGGFGFLICGFGTFFAINPSTPALMAVSTVLLMWIGEWFCLACPRYGSVKNGSRCRLDRRP